MKNKIILGLVLSFLGILSSCKKDVNDDLIDIENLNAYKKGSLLESVYDGEVLEVSGTIISRYQIKSYKLSINILRAGVFTPNDVSDFIIDTIINVNANGPRQILHNFNINPTDGKTKTKPGLYKVVLLATDVNGNIDISDEEFSINQPHYDD